MNRPRKYALALGLLGCAAGLWKLRAGSHSGETSAGATASVATQLRAQAAAAYRNAAPAKQLDRPTLAIVPMIDDVQLDPGTVCQNEPVTLTVRAHDPEGRDREMYVVVNGKLGNPTVLSFASPGEQKLQVTAFNKRGSIDHREVALSVRECAQPLQQVGIEAHGHFNSDRYTFVAKPSFRYTDDPGGKGMGPLSFRWDFGDGSQEETSAPYVEHDFGSRPMTSVASTFLVRVEARSGRDKASGVTNVTFQNTYVQNKLRGFVTPRVSRIGIHREQSTYSGSAVIENLERESLHLSEARVDYLPCAAGRDARSVNVAVDAVFGTRELPPGRSLLKFAFSADGVFPTDCRVLLEIRGFSAAQEKVYFEIAAVIQDSEATETIDASAAYADPTKAQLLQQLKRAEKLLGKRTITADELDSLRWRGELD